MTSTRRPRIPLTYALGLEAPLPGEQGGALHVPPVDIVDEGTGWRLVFEIPGAIPDRLSVDIKGRVVVLRGERRPTEGECGRFLRVERAAGPFERALELPEEPDPEGARASYMDGLLTLEIPRRVSPKGRSIPIQRGPGTGRSGGHT
jgi:HSP20 family protein